MRLILALGSVVGLVSTFGKVRPSVHPYKNNVLERYEVFDVITCNKLIGLALLTAPGFDAV